MRTSYRFAIASCALCTALLFTSLANAAYILFGEGYVPQPSDTYVPADAGACCIGEAPNFTNVYLAQTFIATARSRVDLARPFEQQLPFAVHSACSSLSQPGFIRVKFYGEQGSRSYCACGQYHEYSFKLSGLKLNSGLNTPYIGHVRDAGWCTRSRRLFCERGH
jgi:hypothetical protein